MGQVRSRIVIDILLSRPGGSIQGESCRGWRELSSYQANQARSLLPCIAGSVGNYLFGATDGSDKGNTMDATLIDAYTSNSSNNP
jgi:hypothetical protein